jgi:uncharacterized protein YndB with AHSA1/START domain
MEHLHYTININAPQRKVWDTMLGEETYTQWASVFNPDTSAESYIEGGWDEGSDIRFLGKEKDGTISGMIGKIQESRPGEFLSIKYSGEIMQGKENIYGLDELYFENYTFKEKDGGTELIVDIDIKDEYKDMFNGMWPKALEVLKQLVEKEI